jgi:ribosomal protein S18 acetylase RimI-like enzyme
MGALRRVSKECAEIKRMRVDPGFQGQGFGRAILQHLERRAAELGYRKLCLDTTTQQKAAQHLYQSHGFKETGRSTIGRFDLILFEKMLPTAQADATHSDGSETQ